jgi:DsbC/DsbD-like thiol-disulfide interchange protein
MRTPKTSLPLLVSSTFVSLAVCLLAARPAAGVSSDWASNPQSRLRLITPWTVAPRVGEIRLGLQFALAPGWHVYWKNSGDAGFPPVVVFAEEPGLAATELLWPAPERFELRGGLVAFGYAGEVVYPVRATLRDAAGDRLRLAADVDYLVCEVDCVPYRYTLTADQPLGATPVPDPATRPLIDSWWDRLPVASMPGVATEGFLDAGGPGGSPELEVRVHGARPGAAPPGLFLEAHDAFDAGRPEVRTERDGVVFHVPLQAHEAGKPLPPRTEFAWTVTRLSRGGEPFSLEARRSVPLRAADRAADTRSGGPQAAARPALDPLLGALLAVAATLAALALWGVLGGSVAESRTGREALGFAAAAVTLAALWGMSRQVSFVGLAGIELALLGMALCSWLWRRAGSRRLLAILLVLGIVACAATVPWLAYHNRLSFASAGTTAD